MLTDAGFTDATFHGWTGYVTSSTTQGGLVMARKPGCEPAATSEGSACIFPNHASRMVSNGICRRIVRGCR